MCVWEWVGVRVCSGQHGEEQQEKIWRDVRGSRRKVERNIERGKRGGTKVRNDADL